MITIKWFQYFQILSLVCAILWYRRLKTFSLGWMLPLLAVVCITETVAANFLKLGYKANYFIYNIYLLVSAPLYFILFYRMIMPAPRWRLLYLLMAAGTMIFMCINFFSEGRDVFNVSSYVVVLLLHILMCCILLAKLAMDETRQVIFTREPHFWIAAGVLIFSLGTVVILGLQRYIVEHSIKIFGLHLYRVIMPALNVILYSSFTFSFYLCTRQDRRYSLP